MHVVECYWHRGCTFYHYLTLNGVDIYVADDGGRDAVDFWADGVVDGVMYGYIDIDCVAMSYGSGVGTIVAATIAAIVATTVIAAVRSDGVKVIVILSIHIGILTITWNDDGGVARQVFESICGYCWWGG